MSPRRDSMVWDLTPIPGLVTGARVGVEASTMAANAVQRRVGFQDRCGGHGGRTGGLGERPEGFRRRRAVDRQPVATDRNLTRSVLARRMRQLFSKRRIPFHLIGKRSKFRNSSSARPQKISSGRDGLPGRSLFRPNGHLAELGFTTSAARRCREKTGGVLDFVPARERFLLGCSAHGQSALMRAFTMKHVFLGCAWR